MRNGSTTLATYEYAGTPGTIGDLTRKQEGGADIALAYAASGATPTCLPAGNIVGGVCERDVAPRREFLGRKVCHCRLIL